MNSERRSDKHGPMLDEQLEREADSITDGSPVESRSDESREKEGPSVDEPTPDARVSGDRDLTPDGALSPDETEARSEIARFIRPSAFPATRTQLLESAREEEAPETVLGTLAQLPEAETFRNVQDVWRALGGQTEERF